MMKPLRTFSMLLAYFALLASIFFGISLIINVIHATFLWEPSQYIEGARDDTIGLGTSVAASIALVVVISATKPRPKSIVLLAAIAFALSVIVAAHYPDMMGRARIDHLRSQHIDYCVLASGKYSSTNIDKIRFEPNTNPDNGPGTFGLTLSEKVYKLTSDVQNSLRTKGRAKEANITAQLEGIWRYASPEPSYVEALQFQLGKKGNWGRVCIQIRDVTIPSATARTVWTEASDLVQIRQDYQREVEALWLMSQPACLPVGEFDGRAVWLGSREQDEFPELYCFLRSGNAHRR